MTKLKTPCFTTEKTQTQLGDGSNQPAFGKYSMDNMEYKWKQKASSIAEKEIYLASPKGPWASGLHWAMYSCVVIAMYEAIQFSDYEFTPNTSIASIVTISLAFLAGYLDQRNKDKLLLRRTSEIFAQLKRHP